MCGIGFSKKTLYLSIESASAFMTKNIYKTLLDVSSYIRLFLVEANLPYCLK